MRPNLPRPRLLAGQDFPGEPRQRRSQEKREQLLTAGLVLFGERGYEQTSVDDIAGKASVAVGSFYQFFRSKQQLLLVLMDQLLEQLSLLDLQPKGITDIRAGLRMFLMTAFSADLHYLGAYRAWQEASIIDAEIAAKDRKIRQWTTKRVTAVFQILLTMPGARRNINLPVLARLMDRYFWSLLEDAVRFGPSHLKASIEVTAELLYHALFRD